MSAAATLWRRWLTRVEPGSGTTGIDDGEARWCTHASATWPGRTSWLARPSADREPRLTTAAATRLQPGRLGPKCWVSDVFRNGLLRCLLSRSIHFGVAAGRIDGRRDGANVAGTRHYLPWSMRTSSSELLIELDRSRPRGLRTQVESRLRDAVRAGRLPAGTLLPSTRCLADDLGITRGVVVAAYEQLVAEGYLTSAPGSGTVVAATGNAAGEPDRHRRRPEVTVVVDFSAGVPDLELFPRRSWSRASRAAMATLPSGRLGYGEPVGSPELRRALVDYLGRVRGVSGDDDRVVVCSGFSHGVTVLTDALRRLGHERIAVEDPHRGAGTQLAHSPLEVHGVELDDEGISVASLRRTGARAVLVTPAHQAPTGVVLSPRRRSELVAWARSVDGYVIEDDYDAEFRYDQHPVGAMQGIAGDRVVYCGTASKTVAPGLRLGWMVLPPRWWMRSRRSGGAPTCSPRRCSRRRSPSSSRAATSIDICAACAGSTGSAATDLVTALRRHVPAATPTGIAAGLQTLLVLPPDADEQAVATRALAAGVVRRARRAGTPPAADGDARPIAPCRPSCASGRSAESSWPSPTRPARRPSMMPPDPPGRVRTALWLPIFDGLADPITVARLSGGRGGGGVGRGLRLDHLRWRQPVAVADPWITMAAIASATESLRFGPTVSPLARRRPAKVARTATLDRLSGGRLTLGVGLGSDRFAGELSRTGEELPRSHPGGHARRSAGDPRCGLVGRDRRNITASTTSSTASASFLVPCNSRRSRYGSPRSAATGDRCLAPPVTTGSSRSTSNIPTSSPPSSPTWPRSGKRPSDVGDRLRRGRRRRSRQRPAGVRGGRRDMAAGRIRTGRCVRRPRSRSGSQRATPRHEVNPAPEASAPARTTRPPSVPVWLPWSMKA